MILIALGANLPEPHGSPLANVKAALERFPACGVQIETCSAFYQTPAVTPYAQPDFINAVARVATDLAPEALMQVLHGLEAEFGRERRVRWSERPLDLDLLDYDGEVREETAENGLILPHPRIGERAFVLLPLLDVAPDWTDPMTGARASDLAAALGDADRAGIQKLVGSR